MYQVGSEGIGMGTSHDNIDENQTITDYKTKARDLRGLVVTEWAYT